MERGTMFGTPPPIPGRGRPLPGFGRGLAWSAGAVLAVAFVIACPLAYIVMNHWLQNFAYRIALSWHIFAVAGLLTLLIALATVFQQALAAATRNPVKALRYE